ncbi:hypothetical protein TorRG33x02_255950 [Trema orientale]|uniref:Uncharacterized protein n=1 Tax=Trema orientale TaxID=63057 RepID=A0A2P5DC99_TREOI|nr:hypothetical protein TorRG33x02_255950 [Trema orientale]
MIYNLIIHHKESRSLGKDLIRVFYYITSSSFDDSTLVPDISKSSFFTSTFCIYALHILYIITWPHITHYYFLGEKKIVMLTSKMAFSMKTSISTGLFGDNLRRFADTNMQKWKTTTQKK